MQICMQILLTFFDKAKIPSRMSNKLFERNAKLKSSTLDVETKIFFFEISQGP